MNGVAQSLRLSLIRPPPRAHGVNARCKYCHRMHDSWWLMPPEEYPVDLERIDRTLAADGSGFRRESDDTRALMCGYCEHVSLACFMDLS